MSEEHKKIRILHVDDEVDISSVVKTILEKEGYEVVSVNKGDLALKEVELDGFSLIILDVMMPDMSGWELFTRIGKIKPDYNVVFLSVLDVSKEKREELTDSGIIDFIKKPFDREDFLARVKKAINTKV